MRIGKAKVGESRASGFGLRDEKGSRPVRCAVMLRASGSTRCALWFWRSSLRAPRISNPGCRFEQILHAHAPRWLQAEMPPCLRGHHAPARGAHEESLLDQERFEHVFDRAALFG